MKSIIHSAFSVVKASVALAAAFAMSGAGAAPAAADPAFGPWQPPPRRVPLAQATAADFDAAFVFGSFPSAQRPQLALVLAAPGQRHDRVVELDEQGSWREFRGMTQLTPCEQGAFVATADRRWFGWRPGTPAVALPAQVWHMGSCQVDIGVAANRSEGNAPPVPHWYALDGRQFTTRPISKPPAPARSPANGWSVRQEVGAAGLVDAQGRWLTARPAAGALELWSLTPALRGEAERAWQQGPQMIDRQGRPVRFLSPGETAARFVAGRWLIGPVPEAVASAPLPQVEATQAEPDQDIVEGLQRFGVNGRWGYADAQGRSVIAPRFMQAQSFSQGLAAVQLDGRWGFIDRRGSLVIPAVFDEVTSFGAGARLTWVKRDGAAQLIDRQGKALEIVAPAVTDLRPMVDGRAAAQASTSGAWGFIDEQARWVVAPSYEQVADFESGFAWVKPPRGNPAPCVTQVVAVLGNGHAVLQRCHRYAVVDEQQRLLVPVAPR